MALQGLVSPCPKWGHGCTHLVPLQSLVQGLVPQDTTGLWRAG